MTVKATLALSLLFFSYTNLLAEKIALISTDSLGYEYFQLAEEALEYSPKIIVFPEWGFTANQENVEKKTLDKWRSFAMSNQVYIALNTRFEGRNTLFVWDAKGGEFKINRRDGNASPVPSLPSELEPLVIETDFGTLGFLICDEVRSQSFLDELISKAEIDFIISPNNSSDFAGAETVLARSNSMQYPVDVFFVDTIGKFNFNGGNHTHVYRTRLKKMEVHRFEEEFDFASWKELEQTKEGVKYSIGIHLLSSNG